LIRTAHHQRTCYFFPAEDANNDALVYHLKLFPLPCFPPLFLSASSYFIALHYYIHQYHLLLPLLLLPTLHFQYHCCYCSNVVTTSDYTESEHSPHWWNKSTTGPNQQYYAASHHINHNNGLITTTNNHARTSTNVKILHNRPSVPALKIALINTTNNLTINPANHTDNLTNGAIIRR